jgi:predicted regulator of Ras-like GTPase activity (Roadblock/LC7/MglB family)
VEARQIALMTQCLWEFQEMTTEVEGLMLIGMDGFVIASTIAITESTSRVAAVVSALVGLAKQVTEEWERGTFSEVRVRFKDQSDRQRDAQLIPVGESAVLVVLLQRTAALSLASITVPFNTRQALQYVALVLNGTDDPPQVTWM